MTRILSGGAVDFSAVSAVGVEDGISTVVGQVWSLTQFILFAFTSRKAGQHVLQVEGVESFSFLEKNYEKIIRKKLKKISFFEKKLFFLQNSKKFKKFNFLKKLKIVWKI